MNIKTLEQRIKEINYERFKSADYQVSQFSLEFISFIKLCNGGITENKSSLAHTELIDLLDDNSEPNILACCHRGWAKSSLVMYFILYCGVFGKLPNFGDVQLILYISDTIENGVKSMCQNLRSMIENSSYLQTVLDVPNCTLNATEWEFVNKDGHKFTCKGYGASSSVRGVRKYNKRPEIAIFDDLLSDKNASSDSIIISIEDLVTKAIRYALDPRRNKIVWLGTPFDKKDPLYKNISTGAWKVVLFPICERYPCTKEEFIGSWEDRFTFEYVEKEYKFALSTGSIRAFNQELMLRIISDEDRLVKDSQILTYNNRESILSNKSSYNFYITTDFATSEKKSADYSVISVWAYSEEKKFYWVDGMVARKDFATVIDDLFMYCSTYEPMNVGVEISGVQQGFISIINDRMINSNIFFPLASDKKSGELGIRPVKSKLERFNNVLHLFQQHRIYFPKDLLDSPEMIQCMDELTNVSLDGFKSAHDDFSDTISQLQFMYAIAPSEHVQVEEEKVREYHRRDMFIDSMTDFERKFYSTDVYSSYLG